MVTRIRSFKCAAQFHVYHLCNSHSCWLASIYLVFLARKNGNRHTSMAQMEQLHFLFGTIVKLRCGLPVIAQCCKTLGLVQGQTYASAGHSESSKAPNVPEQSLMQAPKSTISEFCRRTRRALLLSTQLYRRHLIVFRTRLLSGIMLRFISLQQI